MSRLENVATGIRSGGQDSNLLHGHGHVHCIWSMYTYIYMYENNGLRS